MKIALYIAIGILVLLGIHHFVSPEASLFSALLGLGAVGRHKGMEILAKQKRLDEEASAKKREIEALDKEREKLNRDGVKDLTPEEEKKYWEDQ